MGDDGDEDFLAETYPEYSSPEAASWESVAILGRYECLDINEVSLSVGLIRRGES
jgi:hypothetical protein